MNRTANIRLLPFVLLTALMVAQESPPGSAEKPQGGVMDDVVARMQKEEQKALRVRLELKTEANMPGGLMVRTQGTLRVLRTEQGELTACQTTLEYSFDDGISGRMNSVKNPDGVWISEQNPTFGEVLLHMDRELVTDLEWAGRILQRTELPGLGDARATAPLGSAMVADLARRYALVSMTRKERNGEDGTWYGGDRKPGIASDDETDVPIAERVEMFIRNPDYALLEVVHLQAGKPIQRIKVEVLVIGEPMPLESFVLDIKGKKPKDVREHPPAWEQIQQMLQSAKSKAGDELPPSARKREKPAGGK